MRKRGIAAWAIRRHKPMTTDTGQAANAWPGASVRHVGLLCKLGLCITFRYARSALAKGVLRKSMPPGKTGGGRSVLIRSDGRSAA